ncbi:MAG TPA: ribonuclease III, partial [Bradyrhizobium sp.]|nr:ribonuclease III [Bradyrhizobium sp.]
MNDETPDIPNSSPSGEATTQPDADRAPVAARKTRGKSAAKAASAAIEARIGHKFNDPSLLMTAFTHVSALKSARKRGDSYQRLEFLGDHV